MRLFYGRVFQDLAGGRTTNKGIADSLKHGKVMLNLKRQIMVTLGIRARRKVWRLDAAYGRLVVRW